MSGAEAQARRYLRWFPGWMRADRGEEAVGLVLDLLPPGAERLPLRARIDLVRAGLHARRVGIPPVKVWWSVVSARPQGRTRPVPPPWRPWLAAWLSSPRWRHRFAAISALPTGALMLGLVVFALTGSERLGPILLPTFLTGTAVVGGWRQGEQWRATVSVVNGLDPVTLGLLPDGTRRPVVVAPGTRDGRAVGRVDAVLGWCAAVLAASALWWATGWDASAFGGGEAVAGLVVGGIVAGTAAATVMMSARTLAARPGPPPVLPIDPLDAPPAVPRWASRAMFAPLLVATIALFELFAAGAAVATVAAALFARHQLRRTEAATGHEITVWGLFPWAGPSVRWIEPAADDQPHGPAAA